MWLTQQYAIIQWDIGLTDGPANPAIGAEFKTRGVISLVDAMLQTLIEGARCDDSSSWQALWDRSLAEREVWQYAATLPEDFRRRIAAEAVRFELEVSAKRKNDIYLCSHGMDAMMSGTSTPTHDPNLPGTTYTMTPDPNYKPKFVPEDVWRDRQTGARKRLPEAIAKLLSLPPPA